MSVRLSVRLSVIAERSPILSILKNQTAQGKERGGGGGGGGARSAP